MQPKARWFWPIFVGGVALDQLSKLWVRSNLEHRVDELQIIPGWLSLVHAQNPGAAFGLLEDFEYRYYLFAMFTMVAVGVGLAMYRRLPEGERLLAASLGLILSGAVGNAVDRVIQRVVTDFVRVYSDWPPLRRRLLDTFHTNEWPAFNVADAALVVGVILFFLHAMSHEGDDLSHADEEATG